MISQQFDFKSFHDMVEFSSTAPSSVAMQDRSSRNKDNIDFYGTDSYETSLHLARYGWPEGLEKIKSLTRDIIPKFYELFPRQDNGEEIYRDVAGNYEDPILSDIDIEPEDMIIFKTDIDKIQGGNKLQRIIIETSASCCIDSETMFSRGACILAMIEALETFGFRLEIILQSTLKYSSGNYNVDLVLVNTLLKAFDDHSDYNNLAFAISNPSYFRRLIFSVVECCSSNIVKRFGFRIGEGYSYPYNHPIYVDKDRDFYIPLPRSNMSMEQHIVETAKIITDRFTTFKQTIDTENPDLSTMKIPTV